MRLWLSLSLVALTAALTLEERDTATLIIGYRVIVDQVRRETLNVAAVLRSSH